MIDTDGIFLVGPQGSGKGTQSRLLAERLHWYHWDMGQVLRDAAASGTELGQHIKTTIESGQLLSDEQLFSVIDAHLPAVLAHQRVIFDGVPRRAVQARSLIARLHGFGFTHLRTLVLNVPLNESVQRLQQRAHHEFRVDDTPETIQKRLVIYQQNEAELLEELALFGPVTHVDGVGTVDEVYQRLLEVIHV